jgi:hypothetical protein
MKSGVDFARQNALSHMEVPVSAARLVLFASLLTLPVSSQPASSQQGTLTPQLPGRNWSFGREIRPELPSDSDLRTMRIQTIRNDAEQLSALSASMQADLQQFQKGVLPRDFSENLKKMEKLSKKLRQEMAQQ